MMLQEILETLMNSLSNTNKPHDLHKNRQHVYVNICSIATYLLHDPVMAPPGAIMIAMWIYEKDGMYCGYDASMDCM